MFRKDDEAQNLERDENHINDFDKSREIFIPAKKRENKLISIRLPMQMIKKLREVAIVKGDIGYQSLIKTYISEGLSNDEATTKDLIFHVYLSSVNSSSMWQEFPKKDIFFTGAYQNLNQYNNY